MKRTYLIDSENINDVWVELLRVLEEKDDILVFYTDKSAHMGYDRIIRLMELKKGALKWIKCFEGQNALDFQLVSELGHRICEDAKREYVIVSNDTGYDAVVRYWQKKDYRVRRMKSNECDIRTVSEPEKRACLPDEEEDFFPEPARAESCGTQARRPAGRSRAKGAAAARAAVQKEEQRAAAVKAAKTGTGKAAAAKPMAAKAAAGKPAAAKAAAGKPVSAKAGAERPTAAKAGTEMPGAGKGAGKAGNRKPVAIRPELKPQEAELLTVEPEVATPARKRRRHRRTSNSPRGEEVFRSGDLQEDFLESTLLDNDFLGSGDLREDEAEDMDYEIGLPEELADDELTEDGPFGIEDLDETEDEGFGDSDESDGEDFDDDDESLEGVPFYVTSDDEDEDFEDDGADGDESDGDEPDGDEPEEDDESDDDESDEDEPDDDESDDDESDEAVLGGQLEFAPLSDPAFDEPDWRSRLMAAMERAGSDDPHGDLEFLRELCKTIKLSNMSLVHNILEYHFGQAIGNAVYRFVKDNPGCRGELSAGYSNNRKQRERLYLALILEHNHMSGVPGDLDAIFKILNALPRKNLNSIHTALVKKFGQERGGAYYAVLRNHVKILRAI